METGVEAAVISRNRLDLRVRTTRPYKCQIAVACRCSHRPVAGLKTKALKKRTARRAVATTDSHELARQCGTNSKRQKIDCSSFAKRLFWPSYHLLTKRHERRGA